MICQKLSRYAQETEFNLPWREERTLYRTFVSEIMLQQTTVATVLNHYESFLKKFPDISSLAQASLEQVLLAWKGLGYYRRAKNLKKACEYFYEHYNGEIPLDYESLIKVPGIGDYTANALLSIGANLPGLAIDTNIQRVVARLYGLEEQQGASLMKRVKKSFHENKIFSQYPSFLTPRELNESLMDIGRLFCKANTVYCHQCPLKSVCLAQKKGSPLEFPRKVSKEKREKKKFVLEVVRVLWIQDNRLAVYKKEKGEWLEGQWEVPTFCLHTDDPAFSQYPSLQSLGQKKKREWRENTPCYKTTITKYSILNFIRREKALLKKFPRALHFIEINDQANFSTATLKALSKITLGDVSQINSGQFE